MKAVFEIKCPNLLEKLIPLVQGYQEDMDPVDHNGYREKLPPHVNPHQYIYWDKGGARSRRLILEGHRHALFSEGVLIVEALKNADAVGNAVLVNYKTSVPEMPWHQVMDQYILRRPLSERVEWYVTKGYCRHHYFTEVFPELAGIKAPDWRRLSAQFSAKDVRLLMRAIEVDRQVSIADAERQNDALHRDPKRPMESTPEECDVPDMPRG